MLQADIMLQVVMLLIAEASHVNGGSWLPSLHHPAIYGVPLFPFVHIPECYCPFLCFRFPWIYKE